MADGISKSDVFVCFLTRNYALKVSNVRTVADDNCFKEFSYATAQNKFLLPVVFERCMNDVAAWPCGVVSMHVAGRMQVRSCSDTAAVTARLITAALCSESIRPSPPALRSVPQREKLTAHRRPPALRK